MLRSSSRHKSCFNIRFACLKQMPAGELRRSPGRLGRTSPGCSRSRRRTGSWGWRTCWRCGRRRCASSASWTCTGAQICTYTACWLQPALRMLYSCSSAAFLWAQARAGPLGHSITMRRRDVAEVSHWTASAASLDSLVPFNSCRLDKARENAAALEVLPDLLREVDALPPGDRLASLVQGVRRSCARCFTLLCMHRSVGAVLWQSPGADVTPNSILHQGYASVPDY